MIFDTIAPRGFEPYATAIASRTIGACYQTCFRPDTRALIGIGIFSVTPHEDGYRFAAEARALRGDELPPLLVDWLEERLPASGAIVSWDPWLPMARRLGALADPDRHPRIVEAVAQVDGRWRELPRAVTWHLKPARATAMPCLCGPAPHPSCVPELAAAVLPDPLETERALIDEAERSWATWANLFGEFDDYAHPARKALAARRELAKPASKQSG